MTDKTQVAAAITVLIVDDEPAIAEILGQLMGRQGYSVLVRHDPHEAWRLVEQEEPTVLISDLRMPGMTGMELLEKIRQKHRDVAMIMISAIDDTATAIGAIKKGAYGYITKPFAPDEVIVQVAGAIHRRDLEIRNREYSSQLERMVSDRTKRLSETLQELQTANLALKSSYEDTILRLAAAAEYRDEESGQHIRRISRYSSLLAQELKCDPDFVHRIELASPMHDIGKIGVPDNILHKPGKLTPHEFTIMKTHTVIGARLFAGAEAPLLQMAGRVAQSHHERFDGTGYPNSVAGKDIPLEARIVAVADVWDALTTERVYKPAYDPLDSLEMMSEQRGKHFDPEILDLFLALKDEIIEIRYRQMHDVNDILYTTDLPADLIPSAPVPPSAS